MNNWLEHLRNFKYWRFALGSVLLSELLTWAFNTIMSLIWWGRVSGELLAIGSIDAFAVALIVAPLVIFLLKKSEDLSEVNQALQRQMLERRRTEDILKESEERYRMLFERSGDSIFVIEAEGPEAGRIVEVNETAVRSHGFTRQEMLAMKVTELDVPESAEQAPDRIRRLLAGEQLNFEVAHFRKDGSILPLEVSAGVFEAGGCRRIVAFDRDISQRRRTKEALRHSEERYRSLVERLPYGLFIFEAATGRFLFVNRYGCDLFGFTPEFARTHAWALHERYVKIEVRDSGQGMPEEVQQHIFEPFYTTKEPGKGTGLGLSAVYSIVQNHQGGLEVESRPGKGTSLAVYLPLAGEVRDGQARQADEEPPPPGPWASNCWWSMTRSACARYPVRPSSLSVTGCAWPVTAWRPWGHTRLAKELGSPFDLVIRGRGAAIAVGVRFNNLE